MSAFDYRFKPRRLRPPLRCLRPFFMWEPTTLVLPRLFRAILPPCEIEMAQRPSQPLSHSHYLWRSRNESHSERLTITSTGEWLSRRFLFRCFLMLSFSLWRSAHERQYHFVEFPSLGLPHFTQMPFCRRQFISSCQRIRALSSHDRHNFKPSAAGLLQWIHRPFSRHSARNLRR